MTKQKYLVPKDMTKEQLEIYNKGYQLDENGNIIGLNPNRFAIYVQENYELIYARDDNFYAYDESIWEVVGEGELRSYFYKEISKMSKSIWNVYLETGYITALKRLLFSVVEFNTKRYLINMKNGMFDTVRLKLIPHDPKYFSTIQIPVEYDKNATCKRYMKYWSAVEM